jgi:hypothetical protein
MWDVFFKNITANSVMTANTTIYNTFMEGGFYAADLDEEIMLISLNGLYPFYSNDVEREFSVTMFNWMGEILADNANKKFII